MRRLTTLIVLFSVMVSGCVTAPPAKDLSKFQAAAPRSLLIVPVVNQSVDVTASDYLLSTMTLPLAEKGYYIFPVRLVKRVLEDDGLSDSNLVHSSPAEKLGSLFGADGILYVTIKNWDAKYFVLSTQVTVHLAYVLKDGRTGETLWEHQQRMVYTPQNSSTGNPIADLIVMAVNAAATKMAPNYMPLARQAHAISFANPGPGIPHGPYFIDTSAQQKK
jgi:hypothetical protein